MNKQIKKEYLETAEDLKKIFPCASIEITRFVDSEGEKEECDYKILEFFIIGMMVGFLLGLLFPIIIK